MPELARRVQVRHVMRGSTPSGLQGKGHRFVRMGHAAAHSLSRSARKVWLSKYAIGTWMIGCSPKQEERRTKATPEPPPRGHDIAPGRRSLSGARRQCCHRVARVRDPSWRYFGRQPDAHASFEFFMRRLNAAIRPTPFTGVNHRPSGRVPCLARDANQLGPAIPAPVQVLSHRTRGAPAAEPFHRPRAPASHNKRRRERQSA